MAFFFALSAATIQSVVPDHLRGRVASIGMMAFGLTPFGGLLLGGLAEMMSAPVATLVGGVALTVLALLISLKYRSIWSFG
jgi:hypothetical protein